MGFLQALFGSSAKEEYAPMKMDAGSAALTTIGFPHHKAHEGNAYRMILADLAMLDTEVITIGMITPPMPIRVHMVVGFRALVAGSLEILEAATWDHTTGTLEPAINRKREARPLPTAILNDQAGIVPVAGSLQKDMVTLVAAGTTIYLDYAWGEKGKIGAGHSRDSEEFILLPGTKYCVRFTAIGAANQGAIILDWYEHAISHTPAT